jgi:hypothetical protein
MNPKITITLSCVMEDGDVQEFKEEAYSFESAYEELGKLERAYEKMFGEAEKRENEFIDEE